MMTRLSNIERLSKVDSQESECMLQFLLRNYIGITCRTTLGEESEISETSTLRLVDTLQVLHMIHMRVSGYCIIPTNVPRN
jgi:hypothetical protein